MIANEKYNLPFGLWQAVSKCSRLLAQPATKLKPAIPPKSGHLGPTTFFACDRP